MQQSLRATAAVLADGGCVIYPTETYFALGARATDGDAQERIAAIKARPDNKPLPLLIGDMGHLAPILPVGFTAGPLHADFAALTERFWPGPLSLVVPCRQTLPRLIKDADDCVAVRFTPHPTAATLCRLVGGALVATSANRSGQPPAATPADLDPAIVTAADALVTAGPLPAGGPASTVVGLLGEKRLRLFRAGAVAIERLRQAGYSIIEA